MMLPLQGRIPRRVPQTYKHGLPKAFLGRLGFRLGASFGLFTLATCL